MNPIINSQIAISNKLKDLQDFLEGHDDFVFERIINTLKTNKGDCYISLHCVTPDDQLICTRSNLNINDFIRSLRQSQIKKDKLIKEFRIRLNTRINISFTSYTDILLKLPEQHLLLDLDYIIKHLYEIFDSLADNFPEVFY